MSDVIGDVLAALAGPSDDPAWLAHASDQLEALAAEAGSPTWMARRDRVKLASRHLAAAALRIDMGEGAGDHLVEAGRLLGEVGALGPAGG